MPDERDISPASDHASLAGGDQGRSRHEGPWRADAHAVVIGINTYLDPKVPDLRFARADAEAVYAVLTDPEVGRFKPENVTLLVDAEATERRIRSALGTALPRRARRDSTVCIYFAGHGAPDIDLTRTSSDGIAKYLIPHDAVADDLRSSGISMDAVQQYFSYLDANQVVCFLDCCYSGAAGGRSFEREGFQTRALLSDEFLDGLASEGRLVITACAASEVSLESPDKGHGLFTYHLVEGLRGAADTGGDGLVTIDELYDYLYQQVERDARSMGGSMKPVRKGSVQGRVYLTEYETTAKKRIRLASEEASAAWARGDVDEATKLWTEVQTLDVVNVAARAGLAQVTERRAQVQAEREEAARRRDEELQRKHQVLLGLFESEQVTPGEYERALGLLDEEVSSLSEIDRRRRRLLDNLIAGSLTLKTYKQSLAAIDRGARRDEPSRPPMTAPTPSEPGPSLQSDAAPPLAVAMMSPPEEPAVVGDRPGSPPESPRLLPPATRPQDDADGNRPSFEARTPLTSSLEGFRGVKRWFAVAVGVVMVVAMFLYASQSDTPEQQATSSSPPRETAQPDPDRAASTSSNPPAVTTVPPSNTPTAASATPPARAAQAEALQPHTIAPSSGVRSGGPPAPNEPSAGTSAVADWAVTRSIKTLLAKSYCVDSVSCRNECDRGRPNACARLGEMYETGRGGAEHDRKRAAELYRTACDGSDEQGCKWLEIQATIGLGAPEDTVRFVAFEQKECDAGIASSCGALAYQLSRTGGAASSWGNWRLPRDDGRAWRLAQKACDLGEMDGCSLLGELYAGGRGAGRDEARAVALYQRACDGKSARGCQQLGFMYENGLAVVMDVGRAVELYRMACGLKVVPPTFARNARAGGGATEPGCADLERLQIK